MTILQELLQLAEDKNSHIEGFTARASDEDGDEYDNPESHRVPEGFLDMNDDDLEAIMDIGQPWEFAMAALMKLEYIDDLAVVESESKHNYDGVFESFQGDRDIGGEMGYDTLEHGSWNGIEACFVSDHGYSALGIRKSDMAKANKILRNEYDFGGE